jgi:hypothetical protein
MTIRPMRIPLVIALIAGTALCGTACTAGSGTVAGSTAPADPCTGEKQLPVADSLRGEISGCQTGSATDQFENTSAVVLDVTPGDGVDTQPDPQSDPDVLYQQVYAAFSTRTGVDPVAIVPGQYFAVRGTPRTGDILFSVAIDQTDTAQDQLAHFVVEYAEKQFGSDPTGDSQTSHALQECVKASQALLNSSKPQNVDQWAKTVQQAYQTSAWCKQVFEGISAKPTALAVAGDDPSHDDLTRIRIEEFIDHDFDEFQKTIDEFSDSTHADFY